MSNMYTEIQLQQGDKRKGMTVSIIVHVIILLLALFPFIINDPTPNWENAIVIDFEEEPSTSSSSSSSSAASSSKAARPAVNMQKVESSPMTQAMTMPQTKMVITAPEPDVIVPPTPDDYFDQQVDNAELAEIDEVDEIAENPVESNSDSDFSDFNIGEVESDEEAGEPSPLASTTSGQGDADEGDGFFDGEFQGEAESGDNPFADGFFSGDWPGGDGSEGTQLGQGKIGDGEYWGDFAGDGLFARKVIQRDESLLAALAQEQGKLVVSLCVDPSGKVVFVECDQQKSTIKNPALQKKAEMLAESYVWDKAAEQECGRLSFIFKLD